MFPVATVGLEEWLRVHVPWNPVAGVRAVAWTLGLAIGLAVCWYQAAGIGQLHRQMAWVGVAVAFLLGEMYVLTGFVLSARRAIGVRRMTMLPDTLLMVGAAQGPVLAAQPVDEDDFTVAVVAGSGLFHRRSCVMIEGRQEIRILSIAETFAEGLNPCGVCLAEVPR